MLTDNVSFITKHKEWQCACIETGAQTTFIGLPQAREYCRYMGFRFRQTKGKQRYRFGNDQQEPIEYIAMQIPIKGYKVVRLNEDIVIVDVPFLLVLYS